MNNQGPISNLTMQEERMSCKTWQELHLRLAESYARNLNLIEAGDLLRVCIEKGFAKHSSALEHWRCARFENVKTWPKNTAMPEELWKRLLTCLEQANYQIGDVEPKAFSNGVTDGTGTIDEGIVRAQNLIGRIEATLEAVSTWRKGVEGES